MRRLPPLVLLGSALIAAAAGFPVTGQRSVSTSGQFLVYGGDMILRGAVCSLAETAKSNLLQLLDLRDDWKMPLVIRLDSPQSNFPEAPPSHLEVSQLGYGLKLQLDLLLSGEIQDREIQRALLRAIMIEMIYRDRGNVAPGTPYVAPPDWMVGGFLALGPGREDDESARLLRTVVDTNRIAPLEDVVRQDRTKLDPPSRRLFDAYSQALLQLLLEAPDGRHKLLHYLADLPDAPDDALADLIVHFPKTLGRAPGKWWALSVARLSASDRCGVLSASETGDRLDQLLRFSITALDGRIHWCSLGDFAEFEKLPTTPAVLARVSRQLALLNARAHPSYRAILEEDYALVRLLAQGKTRGVRQRLDRVASYRRLVEGQIRAIDDYLNWYEATQFKTVSGAFSRLLNSREAEEQPPARRHDSISVYLDLLELEMQ